MSMYRTITVKCDAENDIPSCELNLCQNTISFKTATFTEALQMLHDAGPEWTYVEGRGDGTGINSGKFLCAVYLVRYQMDAAYDDEARQESETPPNHPEVFPPQDVVNEQ